MHKYHAIRTDLDGYSFASRKEASRYSDLKLLVMAGAIHDLELQPRYPLEVAGKKIGVYVADFRYREKDGRLVVEDVKGIKTPVYKLKAKLVEAIYGITIAEV